MNINNLYILKIDSVRRALENTRIGTDLPMSEWLSKSATLYRSLRAPRDRPITKTKKFA